MFYSYLEDRFKADCGKISDTLGDDQMKDVLFRYIKNATIEQYSPFYAIVNSYYPSLIVQCLSGDALSTVIQNIYEEL